MYEPLVVSREYHMFLPEGSCTCTDGPDAPFSEKDINRSREAGFVMHLTKPISAQSLDKALAELHRK
jgi:hypothetical protein